MNHHCYTYRYILDYISYIYIHQIIIVIIYIYRYTKHHSDSNIIENWEKKLHVSG